jgi:hypothetical protein
MDENTLEENLLGENNDHEEEMQGEGGTLRLNPDDVEGIRLRHSSSFER